MNWGKKLIIGMALFMIFILGLGAAMIVSDRDDLLESDYYEKGQTYDNDFEAKKAAIDDEVIPTIEVNEYGVTITFPVPVQYQLLCRRPSDSRLDRTFAGFTEEDMNIRIQKGELVPGPWLFRIEYVANGKNYLFEFEINMP